MVLANNFEDGSTQGWRIGNAQNHPNPPSNIASGGPDGADDNFLQTQATGGNGAGSRLAFYNENAEWTGDYTIGGVTGIRASANNQGSGNIVLRVALDGAGGRFVTTEGVTLAPGIGWQDVAFSITAADLTAVSGGTAAAATLADVSQIRFINSPTPAYQGAAVAAELGIDNIATVGGEPGVPIVTPPPTGDLPIVSFEVVPDTFSEEDPNNLVEWRWTVAGDFPEDGLVVNLNTSGGGFAFAFTEQFAADPPSEFVNSDLVGFDDETGELNIRLDAPEASFKLYFVDDILEEGIQEFEFVLADGDGYTVDANMSGGIFTITDDNGGPGVGPTVGLSISDTDLAEGDSFTVTFTVEGEIPADGVQVLVQSDISGSLGQFDLTDLGNITTTGIAGLPTVGDGGGGSFFVTITEPTATITLGVFDDILAEDPLPITFTLANGELYEVDADAASTTLTISDEVQPAGPTVGLSVDRTDLVEGGEPVTLTISVAGDIPEGGLPILINDVVSAGNQSRSLTEFDVGNFTTTGISGFPEPAEGDSGFFITVTEPTATITLAALDDGADEDEAVEQFNFAVIDGEAYEVDANASSVTVSIADAPPPALPVISFATTTPVVTEDEQPAAEFVITVDGDIPDEGIEITIGGDVAQLFAPGLLDGNVPLAFDPPEGLVPVAFTGTEVVLNVTVPEVTATATIFDDILEEASSTLTFELLPGEGFTIGQGTASVTFEDGASANPGGGPTVSLSVSDTDLEEGDELTVNFDVDGDIPEGGLQVFVDGGPTDIGEFNIFNEDGTPAVELQGINEFPLQGGDDGGFFVTLNENQASLTLSVFEDGPGEGEEVLSFALPDGEQYEVNPDASSVDITINDTPEGRPIVSLTVEPASVSEEDEGAFSTATFTVANGEIPEVEFDAEGNYVSGGLSVFFDGDVILLLDEVVGGPILQGSVLGSFFDPEQPTLTEVILLEETSTITLNFINDVIEEAGQDYSFTLVSDDNDLLGSNYAVNPNASEFTLTLVDGNGGPGVGPTVGITTTETDLVEGGTVTLNLTVDGEIPADGLEVLIQSPTPGAIGEFAIFDENGNFLIETTGLAGFPISADGAGSSFLATITEPNASITLSVFEDAPGEGLETLTFEVVNGEEYEVSETNGSITINIDDAENVNYITPVAEEFEESYSTQSLGRVPLDTGGFVPAGYGGIAFLDDDTLLVTGNPYSPEATIYEVDVTRDAETGSITGFTGPATFFATAPGIGSLVPESEPEPGGLDGGLTVAPNGTILYATYFDNSIGQILPGSTAPDAFIDLTALGVEPSTGSLEIVPDGAPGEGRLKITSFDGGTLYDAALTENADGTYDITIENTVTLDTDDLFRGIEGLDYVDESYPGFTADTVLISEYDTNNISAFEVDDLGNPIVDTERTFLDGLTGSGAGGSFDLIVDPVTGDLLVSYDSAFTADDADQGGRLLLITDEAPPTAVADNDPFDNAVTLDTSSGSVTASGAVSTSNDVYAINATAGELLSIEIDVTEALTGIAYTNDDTQLYLYNEAGDVLAFSEDKPDSFASNLFNYLVPETGTYYAAVTTAGNEPILELGQVNQLLGFEETGLANVVYDITVDAQDVPATARLFDIALEAAPDSPIGNVLIDGDQVLFIDLNGSRNTDITGSLTIEVNAEEVNSPENTLDNTLVFEDTLSFGLDIFDFILDFDEPFASTDLDDIIDSLETSGITAIIPPDQLIQRIVFSEQFIDTQVGSDEGETIVGNDFHVSLDGQGGDDTIAGGLGNDLILGGDGDDVLRGDLNERDPQNDVAGGNDVIFGGEGNDRIGGKAGNDILSGDAGDDVIYGDAGDDVLMGVTGNDILVGDNFSGGQGGSDLFVFGNGDGTDTILDFEVGIDRIGLVDGELTFADLTLTQDGANTLLGVTTTGEALAILNNVQASALTENSFAVVPDVSNPEEALALI